MNQQRKYDLATAKALMKFAYPEYGEHDLKPYEIKKNGVYATESFRAVCRPGTVFDWTPADEMEWSGSPNPDTAPFLQIPFEAAQLAAAMIDGPGQAIALAMEHRLGYPLSENALDRFSARGAWMRDALVEAYEAAAAAQSIVGEFAYDQEEHAHTMAQLFDDANGQANDREGVFEQGISQSEARERRARAVASVADLKSQTELAQSVAADNWKAWRRAMVGQLIGNESRHHIARLHQEMQSYECRKWERAAEAVVQRREDAESMLKSRQARLNSPETPIHIAEANVKEAERLVAQAKHEIKVMRGDFFDVEPLLGEAALPNAVSCSFSDAMGEHAGQYHFWDGIIDLEYWASLTDVSPREAAMLLCLLHPTKGDFEAGITTMSPGLPDRQLERLDRKFSDYAVRFPGLHRSLLDWYGAAQAMQIKLAPEAVSFMTHVAAHAPATPTATATATATTTATANESDGVGNPPVVPFSRSSLIKTHVGEWPTIERDIADANKNGLANAAKAGKRGWKQAEALQWARAKGKLTSSEKPVNSLAHGVHTMASLPGTRHKGL